MFPIIVLLTELALLFIAWIFLGIAGAALMAFSITMTIVFFYYAAKNKQQASFVNQDTIEFVVKGGKLADVLENIDGWHYHKGECWFPVHKAKIGADGKIEKEPSGKIKSYEDAEEVEDAVVPDKGAKDKDGNVKNHHIQLKRKFFREFLINHFGFFWVSALYPQWTIHRFLVPHLRTRSDTDIEKDAPIEKWLDNSVRNPAKDQNGRDIPGMTEEKALLWKFTRPALIRDVEFLDMYQANVLLEVVCQIVKPRALVFTYKERFFPNVERAVQSAALDELRSYKGGYDAFIESGATGSQSEFYWKVINPLNFGPKGLIHEFGIYLMDSRVVQIESTKQSPKAREALQAEKVAVLEGKGILATAEAQAKAKELLAKADAAWLREQLAVPGITPEVLLAKFAVDMAQKRAEGNAAFAQGGGTTLVEGGAQTGTVLTPTPRTAPPPAGSGGGGTTTH